MKSTDFPSRDLYDFCQKIEEAGGNKGYRIWEVFDAFVFCSFASLRQAVYKLTTGVINAELEAAYLERIKDFPHPEKLAHALGMLIAALEEKSRDFLGDAYQALYMANKRAGQFFTPTELCRAMAQMMLGDTKPDPESRLTLGEPAMGGGATIIAAVEVLKANGFGPRDFMVYGTDIDATCFYMAYIQLTLLGIPAVLTRGDGLWPKPEDTVAPTLVAAMFPLRESQRKRVVEITARTRPTRHPITARTRTR